MKVPLTGNINIRKSFLTTYKRRCEREMIKRRNTETGYPKHFKFDSVEAVKEYLSHDKIECLLCGRWFKSLGTHLKIHEIGVREYKEKYGLPYGIGLAAASARQKWSEGTAKRHKEGSLDTGSFIKIAKSPKKGRNARSSYRRLQDLPRLAKALKGNRIRSAQKTHCKRGHLLPEITQGRDRRCPICPSVRAKEWYRKNGGLPREEAQKLKKEVPCVVCQKAVMVAFMGGRDYSRCKECKKAYQAEYRANNPERKKELARAWYLKQKEKAKCVDKRSTP